MVSEEFEELKENKEVESNNYKCPSCGGPTTYDPETMTLKCDFCGNVTSLTAEACNIEFDIENVDSLDNAWQNETHVIKCTNCGSENVVPKKELSLTCPFCGSNQVVKTEELAGFKPNRVIPFRIGKEKAGNAYKRFLRNRLFVPSNVKKMIIEVLINGCYLPAWTYDADTISSYDGRLGKHYTTTVGSGKNRRTVTRTRYFHVSGMIQRNFDDILINAGKSVSQVEVNKVCPFSTNDSTEYNESFLAGFSAEHYSKDVKSCLQNAKSVMKSDIEAAILNRYSYDVVSYLNVNTKYQNIKYKYVLLPVWIGNFYFHSKRYRFIVNGETGKVTGKYPVSPIRVTIATLLALIGVIAIIYFIVNY